MIAYWTAIVLLLALAALGLNGAIHELSSADTSGQQIATATQFGYAILGIVAAGALLTRRGWAQTTLWLWAGLITITGGLAPVVWGGAGVGAGLAAGVVSAAIGGFVIWLAGRSASS